MPNWVENKITIEADATVLDEIQNKVRTTYTDEDGNQQERQLIATNLIPMPDEIRMLDGTETNIRRFKDLDGNLVKIDQMRAVTFYSMNDEELLGEGYTMETLTGKELEELDEKYDREVLEGPKSWVPGTKVKVDQSVYKVYERFDDEIESYASKSEHTLQVMS